MTRPQPPISLDQLRVFQLEPNLTAILPGQCQARCRFCVEPESKNQAAPRTWLESFESLVNSELPEVFQTLTLSGGEPTLSPVFDELLRQVASSRASGRLKRVVLTTNGHPDGLASHLEAMAQAVTHVNISRHAVDDAANARVFKTAAVPTKAELAALISRLNHLGLPVNLNCVFSPQHAFGEKLGAADPRWLRAAAKGYISFAKSVGASSVVFRLDHRATVLDPEPDLERAFADYRTVHEARCDSCRVTGKLIRGLPVHFKRSLHEPIKVHREIELYELILHSDAQLYRDWSRLRPMARPLLRTRPTEDWLRLHPRNGSPFVLTAKECDGPQATCTLMTTWLESDGTDSEED